MEEEKKEEVKAEEKKKGEALEGEVGRIKKTDSISVIVRISEFHGEKGVDVREYVETNKYTGYTKKGTRIPWDKWKAFRDVVNKVPLD